MKAIEKLDKIGDTACYIQDYNFQHLFDLPKEVALLWVKKTCPENAIMGDSTVKELTIENMVANGWLNKLFVIVDISHDVKYAIVNWDGKFSLRQERIEK